MAIDTWNTPHIMVRDTSEDELWRRIKEKTETNKFELVGEPKKRYMEATGNMWYARLKMI